MREVEPSVHRSFHIFDRIGSITYRLELPRDLECIYDVFNFSMLRKYISDYSHVLEAPPVELRKDWSFKMQPVRIMDQRMKVLRNKVIPMVKVLWKSDKVEERT